MHYSVIILLITLPFIYTHTITLITSEQIQLRSINKCVVEKQYPITVDNVTIQLINSKVSVTGSLNTTLDLEAPIKAVVEVERKTVFGWIKIPCVRNIGSCIYPDLCIFGKSKNESCSSLFIENNVPCRCPISKGSYRILPKLGLVSATNVISGRYYSKIQIIGKGSILACYIIYFDLYDDYLVYNIRGDRFK